MDADGSGEVDFHEFYLWWKTSGGTRDKKHADSEIGKRTKQWADKAGRLAGHKSIEARKNSNLAHAVRGLLSAAEMRRNHEVPCSLMRASNM